MSSPSSPSNPETASWLVERRGAAAAPGLVSSMRRVKGALTRPLTIERRDGRLEIRLVDRRRPPPPEDAPPTLAEAFVELHDRLLDHEHDRTALVLRHLVTVHNEVARKGWQALETMPSRLIARALVQADILAGEQPSSAMPLIVDRLRLVLVAAGIREERLARQRAAEQGEPLEVSEATREEYDEMERVWIGTVPGVTPPAEPAG
ncbi:MAG: hypothetical protein KGM91_06405 [Burkholderiales bacterium]|nr:hypothetical protein [Burkholderiales bacterium]